MSLWLHYWQWGTKIPVFVVKNILVGQPIYPIPEQKQAFCSLFPVRSCRPFAFRCGNCPTRLLTSEGGQKSRSNYAAWCTYWEGQSESPPLVHAWIEISSKKFSSCPPIVHWASCGKNSKLLKTNWSKAAVMNSWPRGLLQRRTQTPLAEKISIHPKLTIDLDLVNATSFILEPVILTTWQFVQQIMSGVGADHLKLARQTPWRAHLTTRHSLYVTRSFLESSVDYVPVNCWDSLKHLQQLSVFSSWFQSVNWPKKLGFQNRTPPPPRPTSDTHEFHIILWPVWVTTNIFAPGHSASPKGQSTSSGHHQSVRRIILVLGICATTPLLPVVFPLTCQWVPRLSFIPGLHILCSQVSSLHLSARDTPIKLWETPHLNHSVTSSASAVGYITFPQSTQKHWLEEAEAWHREIETPTVLYLSEVLMWRFLSHPLGPTQTGGLDELGEKNVSSWHNDLGYWLANCNCFSQKPRFWKTKIPQCCLWTKCNQGKK